MSFATDKWFQHIRGEMLTEGLADIGLDEMIQRKIEAKILMTYLYNVCHKISIKIKVIYNV